MAYRNQFQRILTNNISRFCDVATGISIALLEIPKFLLFSEVLHYYNF